MSIKDLERQKAQFAYECINKASEELKEDKKEYKSYVKKIPIMILNNGLASTFTFIFSKKQKNKTYELLYIQINEWLEKNKVKSEDDKELVEFFINQDNFKYRIISNEILSLFTWLKRFADGMIEDDGDGNYF